ncbi:MAG: DUF4142 domain-containing protein [Gemmatimonadota bacterium]
MHTFSRTKGFTAPLSTALFLVLTAGLLACAEGREGDAPDTGARTEGIETADAPEILDDVDPASESATGAGEAGAISDSEITAVVSTVNQAEIQAAQLALQKGTSPQVKDFAQKMVNEHKGLQQQARSTAEQGDAEPDPNALSARLQADAEQSLETLRAASGTEFDRAYIDSQVTMYRKVLDTIDDQLLPSADDAELQRVLQEARTSVSEHLNQAEEIQQTLGA